MADYEDGYLDRHGDQQEHDDVTTNGIATYNPNLNYAQRISLITCMMTTGTLSVIGSSMLIYNCVKKLQQGLNMTYHRLLLGMSVLDVIASFLCGTLVIVLVPRESGALGTFIGTQETCSLQGFGFQLSVGVPLYSASLSIYFAISILLAQIHARVDSASVSTKVHRYLEPVLHFIPISVALSTAIIGLVGQWYNPFYVPEVGCWIDFYPAGCEMEENPEEACTRGAQDPDTLHYYKWAVLFWPLVAACVTVVVSNVIIFGVVLRQERSQQRHQSSELSNPSTASSAQNSRKKNEHTRVVAVQNLLYVLAMLNTVLWNILADVAATNGNLSEASIYPLYLLFTLTYPSQGIFSFLVYIRRKYIRLRLHGYNRWSSFVKASFPDSPQALNQRGRPPLRDAELSRWSLRNYFKTIDKNGEDEADSDDDDSPFSTHMTVPKVRGAEQKLQDRVSAERKRVSRYRNDKIHSGSGTDIVAIDESDSENKCEIENNDGSNGKHEEEKNDETNDDEEV